MLAADLAFFFFFPTSLSNILNQFFEILPFPDNQELTFMLIIGLVIAILLSILLVQTIVKSLMNSIQEGSENE
jgi:undecaprenyl pyrophosphate phosphatase UppP